MWLATLRYRHSSQFADKIFHTCPPSSAVVPPSQRGKSTPDAIVIYCESIRAHILRHSPSASHHRRAHVLYLPPELRVKALWKDFLDTTNITCGYSVYRTECIKLHISFAKLGQEECAKCVTLDGLAKKEHEQEAGRRRTTYEIEAANFKRLSRQPTVRCDEAVYTLDIQKVILLPRIDQYKECHPPPGLLFITLHWFQQDQLLKYIKLSLLSGMRTWLGEKARRWGVKSWRCCDLESSRRQHL